MATSFFYNIIDAVANNTYILMRKAGEYKPSKNAFLKKLTFDLAKPGVGIRQSLFNQKHSLRSAVVLVGFPAPSVLAELPSTVKTSRIMRCMECRKLTRSRCDDCGRRVCPRHWQLVWILCLLMWILCLTCELIIFCQYLFSVAFC